MTGYVLGVAALADLVGDVMPQIPPRDSQPSLAGRVVAAGFVR